MHLSARGGPLAIARLGACAGITGVTTMCLTLLLGSVAVPIAWDQHPLLVLMLFVAVYLPMEV
jgi:hypothetical protein